ncbi:MAG TPA: aldo/keto reductase, partial [Longimicrobium sp.]|nr:aldo/keto reductase [Longimicrobium sp.]
CDVQQLRMAQEVAPVTAVASPWLPMDAEVGREILPHCAAAGIGVIGHLPRFGELPPRGSRFEAGTRLAIAKRLGIRAAHLRLEGLHQLEPGTTRALAAASELERIAGEHGRSVDEVAVAWGTQLSAITGVAISALTAAQVEDSLGDGAFRLADEDIARIDAAWR